MVYSSLKIDMSQKGTSKKDASILDLPKIDTVILIEVKKK